MCFKAMLKVSSLLVPLSLKHSAQLFPTNHVSDLHMDLLFLALVLERVHRRQYTNTCRRLVVRKKTILPSTHQESERHTCHISQHTICARYHHQVYGQGLGQGRLDLVPPLYVRGATVVGVVLAHVAGVVVTSVA